MTDIRRITRWVVISGSVGVLMAAIIYALGNISTLRTNVLFNPYLILALAPATILGLAEPTTLASKLILFGIVFSTNFVLYGFLGLLLYGVQSWIRYRATAP